MAKTFGAKVKAAIGAAVASSLLIAAPAAAQHRGDHRGHHGGHDRIDAGDVIAGAVVIGGLAAILGAASRGGRSHDRGYDRGYDPRYDRDYGGYDRDGYGGEWRRTGSREAVQQCVAATERRASYSGNRADVTQITEIDRVRGGYEVRGRLAVDDRYGRYDRYDRRAGYDRDDRYDRRGYDDDGRFRCTVRYGRVQDLRIAGVRG